VIFFSSIVSAGSFIFVCSKIFFDYLCGEIAETICILHTMNIIMNMFEKSVKFGLVASIEYSREGIISKQIVRNNAGNVTLFSFDEGQSLSEHTISFDQIIHILEGEANVIIGGQENILTAGEAVIMPANEPHALKAVQKFKMILITIKG
jgi:quercetin dioxygenase-like cupin family protein